MYSNLNNSLSESDKFVENNKEDIARHRLQSERQQADVKAKNDYGVAMAKANAQAKYENALNSTFDSLRESISGLTQNITNIFSLHAEKDRLQASYTPASNAGLGYAKETKKQERTFATQDKPLAIQEKERPDSAVSDYDVNDQTLKQLEDHISILQDRRNDIKAPNTSIDEYNKWYQQESLRMVELVEPSVLERCLGNISSYEQWKAKQEYSYQTAISKINKDLSSYKELYLKEKEAAKAAYNDYDSAYNRKHDQLRLAGLDDEEVAQHMNTYFPSSEGFYKKTELRNSFASMEALNHPLTSSLSSAMRGDQNVVDHSWRELSNFKNKPLDKKFFETQLLIIQDRINGLEEQIKIKPTLKALVKTGKVVNVAVGASNPLVKVAAAALIESVDYRIDSIKFDENQAAIRIESINKSTALCREIIQRTGVDEGAINNMYDNLNSSLRKLAEASNLSAVRQVISETIKDNEIARLGQISSIRNNKNIARNSYS
jgi:hypothetical protein